MVEAKEHVVDDLAPGKGIEIVDPAGKPIGGLEFEVRLADGKTIQGTTKDDGIISVPSSTEGDVEIKLAQEEKSE